MKRPLFWLVALAIAAALWLGLRTTPGHQIPARYRGLANPIPPTASNLTAGRRLYVLNCAFCHGFNGRGDGVPAAGLRPAPADLVGEAAGASDASLFYRVSEGERRTAMPAWQDTLSEQQRWLILLYVRHLAGQQPEDAAGNAAVPTAR